MARHDQDGQDGQDDRDEPYGRGDPYGRYDVMALDVTGTVHGHRSDRERPDVAAMGAFGDRHGAGYVQVDHEDGQMVFARDGGGRWHLLSDHADRHASGELVLWFDLLHHYPAPGRDDPGHPLAGEPDPGGRGELERTEALRLVAERIAATGAGQPVDALVAERFPGGWHVHDPARTDGRGSAFLVGDLGRIREAATSLPPAVLRERFRAEEAFLRRTPEREALRDEEADLWEAATRPPGAPPAPSRAARRPAETTLIKQAAGLLDPIVQQLAGLGPKGWESLTAVFSCTVGAETARLAFRRGRRETVVRVPEKLLVLVRRQRHLAARTAEGPWYRLLVEADAELGSGGALVDYDLGEEPLPDEDLLAAVHYREDLFAYPRPAVPAWLTRHLAAEPPVSVPSPVPVLEAPAPVVDVKHAWKRLYADGGRIAYGEESIALADVEWVCYPVSRTVTRRFLGPSSYTTTYGFGVGPAGRALGDLRFTTFRKNAEPPREWTALVDLVRREVEPRLLERHFEVVAAGGAVSIGALRLDREGASAKTGSGRKTTERELPWGELAPVRVADGFVSLYRAGGGPEPVFQVPLGRGNAVLLPALLPALARLFTGRPLD
ncbi:MULTISPECIES: hypothetical protein [Kitasatospora]|uniref:Uncharacterized protein n=1 Tax=Kitasatospora setae (strain ATCC 33774 / DSM 43861 / JCM 3304 / KCC A-0304 / NBRC 14216 / KM-6054) TaxID=452652 RepID=E4N6L4_KITSK|nr:MULTISPECIES: hypothetical protein [Kitasatospora]BAJ26845.1 hypothetical protein KSE_10100 [Kitasatospora setae KM-6054]